MFSAREWRSAALACWARTARGRGRSPAGRSAKQLLDACASTSTGRPGPRPLADEHLAGEEQRRRAAVAEQRLRVARAPRAARAASRRGARGLRGRDDQDAVPARGELARDRLDVAAELGARLPGMRRDLCDRVRHDASIRRDGAVSDACSSTPVRAQGATSRPASAGGAARAGRAAPAPASSSWSARARSSSSAAALGRERVGEDRAVGERDRGAQLAVDLGDEHAARAGARRAGERGESPQRGLVAGVGVARSVTASGSRHAAGGGHRRGDERLRERDAALASASGYHCTPSAKRRSVRSIDLDHAVVGGGGRDEVAPEPADRLVVARDDARRSGRARAAAPLPASVSRRWLRSSWLERRDAVEDDVLVERPAAGDVQQLVAAADADDRHVVAERAAQRARGRRGRGRGRFRRAARGARSP